MTIKEAIMDAASTLGCWRADLLLPDSWSKGEFGQGYCRALVADKVSFLRRALRGQPRSFRREVGQVIQRRLKAALEHQRALINQRAA